MFLQAGFPTPEFGLLSEQRFRQVFSFALLALGTYIIAGALR